MVLCQCPTWLVMTFGSAWVEWMGIRVLDAGVLWRVLAVDKIEAHKEPKQHRGCTMILYRSSCLRGYWKFLPISTIQFRLVSVNSTAGRKVTHIHTYKSPDMMSIVTDFIPLSAVDHISECLWSTFLNQIIIFAFSADFNECRFMKCCQMKYYFYF